MAVSDSPERLAVVLGATGFIGSAVLRELAARPGRVRAVARGVVRPPADARADVETHRADLTDPGAMADAVAGADLVVHTVAHIEGTAAWRVSDDDSAAERVNVGLVRDLVRVLRERRERGDGPDRPVDVLFAGTTSQVGPSPRPTLDGTEPDRPRGAYDRQKLAAERELLAAHARGVLRGVSLRLPTVFGHGPETTARDKGVVSTMVRRALSGERLPMWHDGTVCRDLVYVEDVARAFAAAVDHAERLAGRRWLIGSGRGAPLGEVFATVARLVAAHTGRPPVPRVSVEPPAHAEAGDFRSTVVDSTPFRAVTGWEPRVPLEEGLRRTVVALAREGGESGARHGDRGVGGGRGEGNA